MRSEIPRIGQFKGWRYTPSQCTERRTGLRDTVLYIDAYVFHVDLTADSRNLLHRSHALI